MEKNADCRLHSKIVKMMGVAINVWVGVSRENLLKY